MKLNLKSKREAAKKHHEEDLVKLHGLMEKIISMGNMTTSALQQCEREHFLPLTAMEILHDKIRQLSKQNAELGWIKWNSIYKSRHLLQSPRAAKLIATLKRLFNSYREGYARNLPLTAELKKFYEHFVV